MHACMEEICRSDQLFGPEGIVSGRQVLLPARCLEHQILDHHRPYFIVVHLEEEEALSFYRRVRFQLLCTANT